jgi:hypothetical protein
MPLTEAAPTEEPLTIDQEMAADWAAIKEKHKEEPESAPEAETPVETQEQKDTRARDESGKFVKADKPTEPKEPEVKGPPAAESLPGEKNKDPAPQDNQQPQRDINRAPSTWKPQIRAEWDKLTPAVRAEIHRREADFQNGQAQLLPDAKFGSEVRRVTEPYRAMLEQGYGSTDRGIAAFMQSAGLLQMGTPQQKFQEITRIAQQFGIDLGQVSGQSEPQTQQFSDPRVDSLLQQMQQQEQQRQAAEFRHLETTADQWLKQADAQGNPLRPYLNDVMQEMSVLIPQIKQANPLWTQAQVLDQAYDRAVWANPDTRAALQGRQQSELEERQRSANQTRVQDAKRAASVNVPRRASTPSPAKPGDMVDTITNTARELGLIS